MEIPSIQEEEDEFDGPILFHQEDTDFELPMADVHAQWIQRLIQAEKASLSQLNFIFESERVDAVKFAGAFGGVISASLKSSILSQTIKGLGCGSYHST